MRDVGRLRRDDVLNENPVGMKHIIVVHVTDFAHRIPHDVDVIEFRLARYFAANNDDIALSVGFAGDTASLVDREAGVEHGIGNGIANFIRVTFTHGFGRKDKTTEHLKRNLRFWLSGESRHG